MFPASSNASNNHIIEQYNITLSEKIGFVEGSQSYENLIRASLTDSERNPIRFSVENEAIINGLIEHLVEMIDRFVLMVRDSQENAQNNEIDGSQQNNGTEELLQNNYGRILNILHATVRANQIALDRIAHDRDVICNQLLNDDQNTNAWNLANIHWTGSDRHKQGQEVLILEYSNVNNGQIKKVVYKPTPLELSALLFGDSSSLQYLRKHYSDDFPEKGFFAQLQEQLGIAEKSIYRIIPRVGNNDEVYRVEDVRNHYGYTEFLSGMNDIYFHGKSDDDFLFKAIRKRLPRLLLTHIEVVTPLDTLSDKTVVSDYFEDNDNAKILIVKKESTYTLFFRDKDMNGNYLSLPLNGFLADDVEIIRNVVSMQGKKKISEILINQIEAFNDSFTGKLAGLFESGQEQELLNHFVTANSATFEDCWHRAGILLAFMYFMGINDGHNENFIVHNGVLYLIDSETSLSFKVNTIEDLTCLEKEHGGMDPNGEYKNEINGGQVYNLLPANRLFYFNGREDKNQPIKGSREAFCQGIRSVLNVFRDENNVFFGGALRNLSDLSERIPIYVRYTPQHTQKYYDLMQKIFIQHSDADLINSDIQKMIRQDMDEALLYLDDKNQNDDIYQIDDEKRYVMFPFWSTFDRNFFNELQLMSVPAYYVNIFNNNLIDFNSKVIYSRSNEIFRGRCLQRTKILLGKLKNKLNVSNQNSAEQLELVNGSLEIVSKLIDSIKPSTFTDNVEQFEEIINQLDGRINQINGDSIPFIRFLLDKIRKDLRLETSNQFQRNFQPYFDFSPMEYINLRHQRLSSDQARLQQFETDCERKISLLLVTKKVEIAKSDVLEEEIENSNDCCSCNCSTM